MKLEALEAKNKAGPFNSCNPRGEDPKGLHELLTLV